MKSASTSDSITRFVRWVVRPYSPKMASLFFWLITGIAFANWAEQDSRIRFFVAPTLIFSLLSVPDINISDVQNPESKVVGIAALFWLATVKALGGA